MRPDRLTQGALGTVILIGLSGCLAGGSADSSSVDLPNPAPVGESFIAEVHSGDGFECFVFRDSVFCRGSSVNADIAVSSVDFALYFEDSDTNVRGLLTYDDTLCVETSVLTRPVSRTPGVATYCIGEATLQNTPGGHPIVYGGPNFSSGVNGSSDVTYASEPMMGADLDLTVVLAANVFTDGFSQTSERSENCLLIEGILTCETFTVDVLGD
jgi:hypothetical protein